MSVDNANPQCSQLSEVVLDLDTIKQRFEKALQRFLERDMYLLKHDVAERAMTHKLGEYLQARFPEYNVDCEYNRNMDAAKMIELPPTNNEEDARSVSTFPDIIVHRRGSNDHNQLIVEAKKTSSAYTADFDREKLEAFAEYVYRYRVGVLVTFGVGKNVQSPRVQWQYYMDGHWSAVTGLD